MKTVVPHDALQGETLAALIEEFVTRDGAVHGHRDAPMESMIESVRGQLRAGKVVIVFDDEEESCTIVPREALGAIDAASSGSSTSTSQTPASEGTPEDPDQYDDQSQDRDAP